MDELIQLRFISTAYRIEQRIASYVVLTFSDSFAAVWYELLRGSCLVLSDRLQLIACRVQLSWFLSVVTPSVHHHRQHVEESCTSTSYTSSDAASCREAWLCGPCRGSLFIVLYKLAHGFSAVQQSCTVLQTNGVQV